MGKHGRKHNLLVEKPVCILMKNQENKYEKCVNGKEQKRWIKNKYTKTKQKQKKKMIFFLLHFDPLKGFLPICEPVWFCGSIGLVGADNTSIEVESRLPRLSRLPVKRFDFIHRIFCCWKC